MLTIEDVILGLRILKSDADRNGLMDTVNRNEHIIAWLRELAERREAPEIIRCGECVHFKDNGSTVGYCKRKAMYQFTDYFCGDAERRTDG